MELRFEKPTTVAQATALLAEAPAQTAILAGGTDLLVALRSGASHPRLVVDIKGLPGIDQVRWSPAGDLVLGAAVQVQRICEDPRIIETFPALAQGAGAIGSLQVRNRATVGGNLANASPCMDTAPPLLVLGARLQVTGSRGEREIPLDAFFVSVKRTTLEAGEIVVSVTVPRPAAGLRSAFDKIKRVWGHDLALVNAAAALDPAAGTLRVAIGSCGITPVLLPPLTGMDPATASADAAGRSLAALAEAHLCPIDDVRATAEYRRDMAALLCRRLAASLFPVRPARP
jgi:CO/xanthine dehydrogenase FAD-binding subunit